MNTTLMNSILKKPPTDICIMRLSAIGDVCHTIPVVQTIQNHWPEANLTWIIGKTEASLIEGLSDIEFIIFDKSKGMTAYWELRNQLMGRKFDLLLHIQESLRSSLATCLISAKIKLGFHRDNAQDFQWWFTTHQIDPKPRTHFVDMLFGFPEALGIKERNYQWNIPVSAQDKEHINNLLPSEKKIIVISPCSSIRKRNWRNWSAEGYAAVANYAAEKYNASIVLTGGGSPLEREYADNILKLTDHQPINLVGKLTLKQLLATLQKAVAVITPDSGPAHMATAVGTPVIGLFATSNTLFTGPYFSQQWVVDKYPEALEKYNGEQFDKTPWGKRVRHPDAMALITIDDVTAKIDQLMKHLKSKQQANDTQEEVDNTLRPLHEK